LEKLDVNLILIWFSKYLKSLFKDFIIIDVRFEAHRRDIFNQVVAVENLRFLRSIEKAFIISYESICDISLYISISNYKIYS
jgi:hypothetical protein